MRKIISVAKLDMPEIAKAQKKLDTNLVKILSSDNELTYALPPHSSAARYVFTQNWHDYSEAYKKRGKPWLTDVRVYLTPNVTLETVLDNLHRLNFEEQVLLTSLMQSLQERIHYKSMPKPGYYRLRKICLAKPGHIQDRPPEFLFFVSLFNRFGTPREPDKFALKYSKLFDWLCTVDTWKFEQVKNRFDRQLDSDEHFLSWMQNPEVECWPSWITCLKELPMAPNAKPPLTNKDSLLHTSLNVPKSRLDRFSESRRYRRIANAAQAMIRAQSLPQTMTKSDILDLVKMRLISPGMSGEDLQEGLKIWNSVPPDLHRFVAAALRYLVKPWFSIDQKRYAVEWLMKYHPKLTLITSSSLPNVFKWFRVWIGGAMPGNFPEVATYVGLRGDELDFFNKPATFIAAVRIDDFPELRALNDIQRNVTWEPPGAPLFREVVVRELPMHLRAMFLETVSKIDCTARHGRRLVSRASERIKDLSEYLNEVAVVYPAEVVNLVWGILNSGFEFQGGYKYYPYYDSPNYFDRKPLQRWADYRQTEPTTGEYRDYRGHKYGENRTDDADPFEHPISKIEKCNFDSLFQLAQALSKQGFEASIFYYNPGPYPFEMFGDFVAQLIRVDSKFLAQIQAIAQTYFDATHENLDRRAFLRLIGWKEAQDASSTNRKYSLKYDPEFMEFCCTLDHPALVELARSEFPVLIYHASQTPPNIEIAIDLDLHRFAAFYNCLIKKGLHPAQDFIAILNKRKAMLHQQTSELNDRLHRLGERPEAIIPYSPGYIGDGLYYCGKSNCNSPQNCAWESYNHGCGVILLMKLPLKLPAMNGNWTNMIVITLT